MRSFLAGLAATVLGFLAFALVSVLLWFFTGSFFEYSDYTEPGFNAVDLLDAVYNASHVAAFPVGAYVLGRALRGPYTGTWTAVLYTAYALPFALPGNWEFSFVRLARGPEYVHLPAAWEILAWVAPIALCWVAGTRGYRAGVRARARKGDQGTAAARAVQGPHPATSAPEPKSPGPRRRPQVIVGVLLLAVVGAALAYSVPRFPTAPTHVLVDRCQTNLRAIHAALSLYLSAHGTVPVNSEGEASLVPLTRFEPGLDPQALICPGVGAQRSGAGDEGSYILYPNLTPETPEWYIIVCDRPGNHKVGGNVLYMNGRLVFFRAEPVAYGLWAEKLEQGDEDAAARPP